MLSLVTQRVLKLGVSTQQRRLSSRVTTAVTGGSLSAAGTGGAGAGGAPGGSGSSVDAAHDIVPFFVREEVASRIDNAAEGTIQDWPMPQERAPRLHNPHLTEAEIKKQYGKRHAAYAPDHDVSEHDGPNNDELRKARELLEAARPKHIITVDHLLLCNDIARKTLQLRIKEESNDSRFTVLVMHWRDRVVDPSTQRREALMNGLDELENDPVWMSQVAMNVVLEEERRVADQMLFAFQRKMREAKALQEFMDRNMQETFFVPAQSTSVTMQRMPDWQERSPRQGNNARHQQQATHTGTSGGMGHHHHDAGLLLNSNATPSPEAMKLLPLLLTTPRDQHYRNAHLSDGRKHHTTATSSGHPAVSPRLTSPRTTQQGGSDSHNATGAVVSWQQRPDAAFAATHEADSTIPSLPLLRWKHPQDPAQFPGRGPDGTRVARVDRVTSIVAAMVGDAHLKHGDVFEDVETHEEANKVAAVPDAGGASKQQHQPVEPATDDQDSSAVPLIEDEDDLHSRPWALMYTPADRDLVKLLNQRLLREMPKNAHPPDDFICPVLNDIMAEPVVLRILSDPTRCIRVEGVVSSHALTSANLGGGETEEDSGYPKLLLHIARSYRQSPKSVSIETDYQLMVRILQWRIASVQTLAMEEFGKTLREAHCGALVEYAVFLALDTVQRCPFPVTPEQLVGAGTHLLEQWKAIRARMHAQHQIIDKANRTIDGLRSQLNVMLRDRLRFSTRATGKAGGVLAMTAEMEVELQLKEAHMLGLQEAVYTEALAAETRMTYEKTKLMQLEELLDDMNTQIYLYNRFTAKEKARWGPLYKATLQAAISSLHHMQALGDVTHARKALTDTTVLSLTQYLELTSTVEIFADMPRLIAKLTARLKKVGMIPQLMSLDEITGTKFSTFATMQDAIAFHPVPFFPVVSVLEETIFGGAHLGVAGYMAGMNMLREGLSRKKSVVVPSAVVYVPRPPSPTTTLPVQKGGVLGDSQWVASPTTGVTMRPGQLRPVGVPPKVPFWHFAAHRTTSPCDASRNSPPYAKVEREVTDILSTALPRGTKFGGLHARDIHFGPGLDRAHQKRMEAKDRREKLEKKEEAERRMQRLRLQATTSSSKNTTGVAGGGGDGSAPPGGDGLAEANGGGDGRKASPEKWKRMAASPPAPPKQKKQEGRKKKAEDKAAAEEQTLSEMHQSPITEGESAPFAPDPPPPPPADDNPPPA